MKVKMFVVVLIVVTFVATAGFIVDLSLPIATQVIMMATAAIIASCVAVAAIVAIAKIK